MAPEAAPSREACSRCRQYSPVSFTVPDEVWAAVVPERFRADALCIICFAKMGDERLVRWDEQIEFHPASLVTHVSLSRGWNLEEKR